MISATGVAFARGRLETPRVLLVHALPPVLTVEVRSENVERLAYARDLEQTVDLPMARLTFQGERITWKVQRVL